MAEPIYKDKPEDYYKRTSEELCALLLTDDGVGRKEKSLALQLLCGRNKDGDMMNVIHRALFRTEAQAEEFASCNRARAAAEKEVAELRAWKADVVESHREVVEGRCGAPDERHCSCVPALRAEVERLRVGDARYEYLRKLNPRQFDQLYAENISSGRHFDDLIDEARQS